MSQIRSVLLLLGGIGVAAIAANFTSGGYFRSAQPAPPPHSEQPAVSIDPSRLDFGAAWETDWFEWVVPVRNHTDAPATVTVGGGCRSCDKPTAPKVVPPGRAEQIAIEVDLTATRCAAAKPQHIREVKIPVVLRSGSGSTEKAVAFELRGLVRCAIDVPVRSIDFGRFAVGESRKPRVIPISGLVGLQQLNLAVDGDSVVAELKSTAPDKWELHVRPNPSATVARHEARLRLTPITATGEQVPHTTIPVVFDVLHDIQPDTPLVVLGAGLVGETLRGSLVVSSLSSRSFAKPSCEAGTIVVSCTPGTPVSQVSYRFDFEQKVEAVGNHTRPVVVRGTDADGQAFEFGVDIQWYGVAP